MIYLLRNRKNLSARLKGIATCPTTGPSLITALNGDSSNVPICVVWMMDDYWDEHFLSELTDPGTVEDGEDKEHE